MSGRVGQRAAGEVGVAAGTDLVAVADDARERVLHCRGDDALAFLEREAPEREAVHVDFGAGLRRSKLETDAAQVWHAGEGLDLDQREVRTVLFVAAERAPRRESRDLARLDRLRSTRCVPRS